MLQPKKVVSIGLVKHLEMQDFVEVALLSDLHLVGWVEGFYTSFEIHPIYNYKHNALLLYIPRVIYSPAAYHRFIRIKSDGKYEFKEKFPGIGGGFTIVKVVKHEPYEMDVVGKRVLKNIKKVEKDRKKYEQTHRI